MRLLCTTDIHAKMAKVEKLASLKPKCDTIVVAGDITDFGGAKEAESVIGALSGITSNLVAVPGNCDKIGVNEYLAKSGFGIHGGARTIGEVGFFGVGGSNITPFGTPQEYSEDTISELLNRAYENVEERALKVLVSHAPPYTTKLDVAGTGEHVGSRSVRRFLDEHEVALVVTGHMHEAKGLDRIGKTVLINPGPLHMGYALVELGKGKVDVSFQNL